jgi:hypothetical protein
VSTHGKMAGHRYVAAWHIINNSIL